MAMATRPWFLPGPVLTRSQTMRSRMPRMSPSSGAKSGKLFTLFRTTTGMCGLPASQGDLRRAGRAHHVPEVQHAFVDEVEQGLGPKPEHQDEDGERNERDDLAAVDLGELAAESLEVVARAPFFAELAEEHA